MAQYKLRGYTQQKVTAHKPEFQEYELHTKAHLLSIVPSMSPSSALS